MAYRLDEIATHFELELAGDGTVEISGLCGLSDDLPRCLSFLTAARRSARSPRSF